MPTLTRNQKRKIASAPSEKEPASAKATTETEVDAERKNKRPRLSKNHGKKIKDPKDLLPDTEYAGWQIGFTLFKVFNRKKKHHGFQYQLGENRLKQQFRPEGSCLPGGFYITWDDEAWLQMGESIGVVTLPKNARVYVETNGLQRLKMKCDCFHLANEPICYKNWGFDWILMLEKRPRYARLVLKGEQEDPEICKAIIRAVGVKGVNKKFMTEDLALYAMRNDPRLKLIPPQYWTHTVCREAVSHNPLNLADVPKEHLDKEMYTVAQTATEFHKRVDALIPEEYKVSMPSTAPVQGSLLVELQDRVRLAGAELAKLLKQKRQEWPTKEISSMEEVRLAGEKEKKIAELHGKHAQLKRQECIQMPMKDIPPMDCASGSESALIKATGAWGNIPIEQDEQAKEKISVVQKGPMDRYLVKQSKFAIAKARAAKDVPKSDLQKAKKAEPKSGMFTWMRSMLF